MRGDHVDQASQLAAEVAEGDLPRRSGYEWASLTVTRHFSKYHWSSMVNSYAVAYRIFADGVPTGALSVERCLLLTTFAMGVKGITQIFFLCTPACSQIHMSEFPLMSLPWACCAR